MPGSKPPYEKADGEVYVIMRFKNDVTEVVRTACYKEKNIIANYKGRVIGIANACTVYEGGCWPRNQGVLVMEFRSKDDAERWLNSDRKFRDKEWPYPSSCLEIIIAPMSYKPPKSAVTFQLIELSEFTDERFQERYVSKVTPIMDKFLIKHGVVATSDIDDKRNGWIGKRSFCILNAYDNPDELDKFYYSDDYGPLKEYRQSACRTENIVFNLDPNLTPPTPSTRATGQQRIG